MSPTWLMIGADGELTLRIISKDSEEEKDAGEW